jgi:hypothetical protein
MSLSLSLQAEMNWSTDECASGVRFLYQFCDVFVSEVSPCSHTAKCTLMQFIIEATTFDNDHVSSVYTAWPVKCYSSDREGTELLRWGKREAWTYNSKKLQRDSYSKMKDICLWSDITLTMEIKKSVFIHFLSYWLHTNSLATVPS